MITLDFESMPITGALPPRPIGLAYKVGDTPACYATAWEDMRSVLERAVKEHCIFHNAAFDLAIMRYWFQLPYPQEIHDTMILLFLEDPHNPNLGLKPNAVKYLGLPPDEQDLLHNWILRNVREAKPSTAGAYIYKAPLSLVEPYAKADVDMTYQLYQLLASRHTGEAYQRERQLIPILVENTLEGIDLDLKALELDYAHYCSVLSQVNSIIYKKLGATFNIDSADELVAAIIKSGLPAQWVYTPTGKRSTSKKNLETAIQDKELIKLLSYRSTLCTYLESFYASWLTKHKNGTLHFSWNQVRNSERGKTSVGTRTGRLSSVPSMLNVPKTPPTYDLDLPPLPSMRKYLLADEGDVWIKRDYSSQELRVLAHYDDGDLMRAYIENPMLDMHQHIADMLTKNLGKPISRRHAKTMVFSILYGQGLTAMSEALGCSYQEAQQIKHAFYVAVPGIKDVENSIKFSCNKGLPIKTFGGRFYFKEPSREIKDKRTGSTRYADFSYKLLNYLIQGSSADITKQALINYNAIKQHGRFMLTVHDEINISGPLSEHKILDEAMQDIKLDVPLLSEVSYGLSYGSLEKLNDTV